jgi:hypothetical protein
VALKNPKNWFWLVATVIKTKKWSKNRRFLSWLLVIGPCPPQGQGLYRIGSNFWKFYPTVIWPVLWFFPKKLENGLCEEALLEAL